MKYTDGDCMLNWKSIQKVDAHVHLLPDEVHKANPEADGELTYAIQDEHVTIMDTFNIEKSIIMPFNDPFLMSQQFSLEAVHKNIVALCEKYPGRYYAFADIDPRLSPQENAHQIKKLFPSQWFKGIKIHPNNTGIHIDDTYNDPIFALASELNIPIAIHSYPKSYVDIKKDDYCSPTRIAHILNRHKNVKAIICHLSGFQWEDCIGMDAYFDISAILPDYVKAWGIEKTKKIIRQFDIHRLLFATDFPCSRTLHAPDIYLSYFNILDDMNFSKDEILKIAYQNIHTILTL